MHGNIKNETEEREKKVEKTIKKQISLETKRPERLN